MRLVKQLQEKENFSLSEQAIADYLLSHGDEITALTARQLGSQAFTSAAAVIRLCHKLGMSGYAEFRIRFAAELAQKPETGGILSNSITRQDTIRSIQEKVLRIEQDAMADTSHGLEPAVIMRTALLLDRAGHIDFYAQDNNIYLASFASYCLLHVQKFSTVHNGTNVQYLQSLSVPPDHVAFIISRTGENRQLIEMACHLRKRHNHIILLTATKASTLAGLADEIITVTSENHLEELGPLVFLTSAKYAIEVLFGTMMSHHYENTLTQNEIYQRMFHI
jgi:DNA-binding MurR/RpiR family transcriptional regulator